MSDLNIVQCTHERHAAAILDIFNDAIVNSTALYDYQPRTTQNMVSWFEAKRAGGFPVIGIEDAEVGFQPQHVAVFAHHAHAQGVEGTHQHFFGAPPNQGSGALAHLG